MSSVYGFLELPSAAALLIRSLFCSAICHVQLIIERSRALCEKLQQSRQGIVPKHKRLTGEAKAKVTLKGYVIFRDDRREGGGGGHIQSELSGVCEAGGDLGEILIVRFCGVELKKHHCER